MAITVGQILKLSDGNLAALSKSVKLETRRRTEVAVKDAAGNIKGNEMAKRAVIVAVAGGHSLHLIGPPGQGKTMLRALALELGLADTFESWPCPCGHHSDPRSACPCTVKQIERYRKKWPIADIEIEVPVVPQREMESNLVGTTVEDIQKQLKAMDSADSLELDEYCRNLLKAAVSEMGMSNEQRQTAIAIARTIACLDRSERIEPSHLSEAINYRMLRRWI